LWCKKHRDSCVQNLMFLWGVQRFDVYPTPYYLNGYGCLIRLIHTIKGTTLLILITLHKNRTLPMSIRQAMRSLVLVHRISTSRMIFFIFEYMNTSPSQMAYLIPTASSIDLPQLLLICYISYAYFGFHAYHRLLWNIVKLPRHKC
jgi:hypothetical protein